MNREAILRASHSARPVQSAGPAMQALQPWTSFHIPPWQVPQIEWRGKRAFDVIGALILAVAFSPVILGVTAWLRLNGGHVLFRHRRIGQGGRIFTCYKFCTMVPNADRALDELLEHREDLRAEWARDQKLRDDPRVTRLGAFLRRTSLDELPQLWNVLRGDMSLVGPRPIVQQEMLRYNRTIAHYLAIKPGLTGLWQISGRNKTGYRRRVALDRVYALRCSFVFDLWILAKTVRVFLLQEGAY